MPKFGGLPRYSSLEEAHRGRDAAYAAAVNFKVGERVVDKAMLSGEVIATHGSAVNVRWNNGIESWISERYLRRQS
jgi:hypothetical protein